ncbi:MAG: AAA domain-containing protein [Peptococcaceae bacterium]|nr:AAA domain-containing protein [Candidatus Syntrophopropionicum ammoniitolerans]
MFATEAKEHLKILLADPEVPTVMLWGPPGVGKSSIVQQITAEKDWGFLDLRLLLLNPIDLRGIPYPNRMTRQADWLTPSFLPHVRRDGTEGIILYDEITSAPRAVQAAAYQLILDRRVGEYTLPEGWRQVAAGNRAQDKGVVNQMPAALANRMIHFEVTSSVDDWKLWAIPNQIDHRVISFLNFRPELLYRLPSQAAEIKAFPSPRSWEFVHKILPSYGQADKAFPAICGAVGEGPATEFTAFCRMLDQIPDADEILDGRTKMVPDSPDMIYACIGALVSSLSNNKTEIRLGNFFAFVCKLMIEYQVLAINDAVKAGLRTDLVMLPEFRHWLAKNADVLVGAD